MVTRNGRASSRRLRTVLGLAASSTVFGIGCNAILGIEKGHLVSDNGGEGGSSVDSGAGGSPSVDASGSGGASESGGSGQEAGGSAGAGTGGKGAGGKGAGGKGTGGSGAGGKGTGGGGGTGTGGVGGAPEPPGVPGEVHCGNASCRLPGQVCCVDTSTGDAHCAASCDSTTQLPVSCDGAEDCTTAKPTCCYPTGGTTAACMASCAGRVFCGSDADCAPGQRCAPGAGALATVFLCVNIPKAKTVWCDGRVCNVAMGELCCYDKTSQTEHCALTCAAGDVHFPCDGPEDCAANEFCCTTHTGVGLFTGTACSTTACTPAQSEVTCGGANGCSGLGAAGDQCCLQNAASSCGTACSEGVVCGTNADCPSGQYCLVVTDSALGKPTGRSVCQARP